MKKKQQKKKLNVFMSRKRPSPKLGGKKRVFRETCLLTCNRSEGGNTKRENDGQEGASP